MITLSEVQNKSEGSAHRRPVDRETPLIERTNLFQLARRRGQDQRCVREIHRGVGVLFHQGNRGSKFGQPDTLDDLSPALFEEPKQEFRPGPMDDAAGFLPLARP